MIDHVVEERRSEKCTADTLPLDGRQETGWTIIWLQEQGTALEKGKKPGQLTTDVRKRRAAEETHGWFASREVVGGNGQQDLVETLSVGDELRCSCRPAAVEQRLWL